MFDGLKRWLIAQLATALAGFDSSMAEANAILSGDLGEFSNMVDLSTYLHPFCYIVVGICLLLQLADIAQKMDGVRWEMVLKVGVSMCLARVAIDICPTFLEACYAQAQEWIGLIGVANVGAGGLGTMTYEQLEPLVIEVSGIGGILSLFLTTFIIVLAIKACSLAVVLIAFGRMFELYVYIVVSPFPMAFLPLGANGGGISRITSRFLKTYIACCLQGFMMSLSMKIFDLVMVGYIENELRQIANAAGGAQGAATITELLFTMLLACIALVMAVMKSGQWAKSIIDAM